MATEVSAHQYWNMSNSAGSSGVPVVGPAILRHGTYHRRACRARRRMDRCDLLALLACRFLGPRFQESRKADAIMQDVRGRLACTAEDVESKYLMDEKAHAAGSHYLDQEKDPSALSSCEQISREGLRQGESAGLNAPKSATNGSSMAQVAARPVSLVATTRLNKPCPSCCTPLSDFLPPVHETYAPYEPTRRNPDLATANGTGEWRSHWVPKGFPGGSC